MRSPSWAVTYQELPASRDVANGTMTPREASPEFRHSPGDRRDLGTFRIRSHCWMTSRIWTNDRADRLDRDLGPLLSELTEESLWVHLANLTIC